jgi:glycerophosphoryl diester phosphodiesterase
MYSKTIEFIPPVIAHRGLPFHAPENTLESFIAARDAGAKWIETDVKLTADGIPVLMHDDTLDRTTSGHGPVSSMTWAKMQTLDAGSWFSPYFSKTRVTSLAELLAFCATSKMQLILELKPSPGRTQATVMVALIEAAKMWPEDMPPPMICSFDRDALMIAAQLQPDWPRGLFLEEWYDDWVEAAMLTQSSTVTMRVDLLTPERLALLRGAPLPILAYTINDSAQAKELLKNGIKAVYSDDAGALIKG